MGKQNRRPRRRTVTGPTAAELEAAGRVMLAAQMLLPRSVEALPPAERERLRELQATTVEIRTLADRQGQLVQRLRAAGASWSAIGWAVATSGEAARQRWG